MMSIEGTVIDDIERKQLTWYGQVQRMPEIEHRRRERPKVNWKQGIVRAMSARNLQKLDCKDRKRWRQGIGQRPLVLVLVLVF